MKNRKSIFKKGIVVFLIVLLLSFVLGRVIINLNEPSKITYNEFNTMVDNKEINKVSIDLKKDTFEVYGNDGKTYVTDNPKYSDFKRELLSKDIKVEEVNKSLFASIISSLAPIILMYFFIMLIFSMQTKKMSGNDTKVVVNIPSVKFSDVAGLKEVKEEMKDMVDFMSNPSKYHKNGAKLPKGAILYGASGTGKTLLAKAVAGESGVPFFALSGSSFIEMFAGVGAKRVRELFSEAKKHSPCIIFIDEIDAIGGRRGELIGSSGEQRQTLNELLTQIDGFNSSDGVLVIGATNRLEDLDEALIRPGRFDKQIMVAPPSTPEEREEVINLYIHNKKLSDDINIHSIAKMTIGFTPAEIEVLLNESSIIATKNNDGIINSEILDEAYCKMLTKGHPQKDKKRKKDVIELTAYHESCHAFLASYYGLEVSKVTITPFSSGAGGVTMITPEESGLLSKEYMKKRIKVNYGGRIGEYLYMGKDGNKITTGASSDIQSATNIIRSMIADYGMNDEVGMLNLKELGINSDEIVLEEAKKLSRELYNEAKTDIMNHADTVKKIADLLIEKETINNEELNEIMKSVI